MIISNAYKYENKNYVVTDVILKVYDTPVYMPPKVTKIELTCIDEDERGKTGKKIYLDPEVFCHCPNAGGTVLKIGEEK